MRMFEPEEFEDGNNPEVIKAIETINKLKIARYVGEMCNSTELPYFANLYWAVQHEYDMNKEYGAYGDKWIPELSNSNWKSVRKWLVDNIKPFIESANRYDKAIEGTKHTMFGVFCWNEKRIDG